MKTIEKRIVSLEQYRNHSDKLIDVPEYLHSYLGRKIPQHQWEAMKNGEGLTDILMSI